MKTTLCSLFSQAVLRRRDNIQTEFEVKNEALASRKADQEAVSAILHPHIDRKSAHSHPPSLHPSEPADVFVSSSHLPRD